jgi:hypothetical protein
MEKAVLSSMLQGGGPAIERARVLAPEAFCNPINRKVFVHLVTAHQSGIPADLISFTQSLRDEGILDKIGGASYLTELQTFAASDGFLDHYIEVVSEKHTQREIVKLGQSITSETTAAEIRAKLDAIEPNGSGDGLPEIQSVSELISKPIVLPEDIIEGLLHKGGKMVLGGGSKSFKTWQLIHLAVAVATGTDYLGFPTKIGRVLYINLELPESYFAKRCQTVQDKRRVSSDGRFEVWNLRGHADQLANLLPKMIGRAGNGKYALIILDPIYKVFGEREENVAHHVTAVMNDLERLAVKSGAAVAFGAHFSKGNQAGKESIDRISGSGAFARDPDSIVILTKHEEDDAFTVETTLRNHPSIEPFVVRWRFPLMERDEMLDPNRLKQAIGRPRAATQMQILDLLAEKPLKAVEWQKLAREEYGIAASTFYEIKGELSQRGTIKSIAGLFSKT